MGDRIHNTHINILQAQTDFRVRGTRKVDWVTLHILDEHKIHMDGKCIDYIEHRQMETCASTYNSAQRHNEHILYYQIDSLNIFRTQFAISFRTQEFR